MALVSLCVFIANKPYSVFLLQMTWKPSPLSSLLNTSWSSTKTTYKVFQRSLRYTFSAASLQHH